MYPNKKVYKTQDNTTIYAFIPENNDDALKFAYSIAEELTFCNRVIFVSITNEIREHYIIHPEVLLVSENESINTIINRITIHPRWPTFFLNPTLQKVSRGNFITENDLKFTSFAGNIINAAEYGFTQNCGPIERLAIFGASPENVRPSGSQTAMGFTLAAIKGWPKSNNNDNVSQ